MNLSDSIGLAIMTIILTFITNIVFKLIQNSTDFLVDKKKFRREHNFAQLKNLYLDLYGVVSQSEYLRYYSKRYRNIGYEFRAYPFFEIIERVNGEEIKNGITEFNKQQICETIIKKSQYASQELLKLAVAYRYVNHNYLKDHSKKEDKDSFQQEELRLIAAIINKIVEECNILLKNCHMDSNLKEIKTKKIDYDFLDEI